MFSCRIKTGGESALLSDICQWLLHCISMVMKLYLSEMKTCVVQSATIID